MKYIYIVSLLFLSFSSFSYSEVTFTVTYDTFINTDVNTEGEELIIHRPNIVITRNFITEAVAVEIPSFNLYTINTDEDTNLDTNYNSELYRDHGAWIIFKHIDRKLSGEYINDQEILEFYYGLNILIRSGTPDFTSNIKGIIDRPGITLFNIGTITLKTEIPIQVEVPDINFGDVFVDSGSQTKSGDIIVEGVANTKISFEILTPSFKLYKIGDTSNGIHAIANIDNHVIKHEDTIKNNNYLIKKLNITILGFSDLSTGRYEGDLTIDINSN